jgi:hypothetical protein
MQHIVVSIGIMRDLVTWALQAATVDNQVSDKDGWDAA